MTPQEIKELLEEVKPHLNPKVEIDKENETVKKFIKAYKTVTGKTLGAGNCKNCIMDAYFEWRMLTEKQLIFLTMERKYKLRDGIVKYANQTHYTNANITDEIAIEMVSQNRNHAKSFVNGDDLLAELDGAVKPSSVKVEASGNAESVVGKPQPKKRGRKRKG